jgi:hypothetical protein
MRPATASAPGEAGSALWDESSGLGARHILAPPDAGDPEHRTAIRRLSLTQWIERIEDRQSTVL